MVNDVRKRHTVRLYAACLIIEPNVGCTGKFVKNSGVGENDAHSTIVGDVLGTGAQRATCNNNSQQKWTTRDSPCLLSADSMEASFTVVLLDGNLLIDLEKKSRRGMQAVSHAALNRCGDPAEESERHAFHVPTTRRLPVPGTALAPTFRGHAHNPLRSLWRFDALIADAIRTRGVKTRRCRRPHCVDHVLLANAGTARVSTGALGRFASEVKRNADSAVLAPHYAIDVRVRHKL